MNFSLLFALVLPPFLWGSNAIMGKMAAGSIPPITLNVLRWSVAFLVLLPFVARRAWVHRQAIRAQWRGIAVCGLWGVASYNAFQYLALTISSPINTSLIGASVPVFILLVGRLFFKESLSGTGMLGAALSMAGVAWIMLRGDAGNLASVAFSRGDLYMLAGTFAWSVYTWLLRRGKSSLPPDVLLGTHIFAGLLWSLPALAAEWLWGSYAPISGGLRMLAIVIYIGVGPSLLAFFCWHKAVSSTSAQLPIFFMNLTPIFTVLLSITMLGEYPHLYHGVGLVFILAGIFLAQYGAARRPAAQTT
jgi:drug/metabolite transporter (DMT)-like permease